MNIVNFTATEFSELASWFTSEKDVVQWGGPELTFPLDEKQMAAMLAEGNGTSPDRWLFSGVQQGNIVSHAQVALDWRHGVARLGRVAVNPQWRGKRIAAVFLRNIIKKVFAEPEFIRLELSVYTFNQGAINIYRKLGFREEGVRRSSVRVGNERWDTAIYAILRSELPK